MACQDHNGPAPVSFHSFSTVLSPKLFFFFLIFKETLFLSVSLKPYIQKEPPVVRVVEGPLFSEVVAYYQHFQQAIRIYNVPGKYTCTNPMFI